MSTKVVRIDWTPAEPYGVEEDGRIQHTGNRAFCHAIADGETLERAQAIAAAYDADLERLANGGWTSGDRVA